MGGGYYDNMWNPYYNGGYAYPQSRYYRPRGAPEVHPYYNHAEQEPVHPYYNRREQEPLKKVVKTIPVMDGNEAPLPAVPKAPVETVPKAPVKVWFESEDAAATKIQAVYRGYCVRKTQPLKHLKVIKAVKGEFETFKKKFEDMEQKTKLCSDSKERLRWAEGIMALLLRLDSLQGVHPEVRLIRKPLTKELLMFQETIDTLSMDSLNGQQNVITTENSDAPQEAEVTDAAAPEDAEVSDAAAPEDAEVTDAAAPEDAEVTDAGAPDDVEVTDAATLQHSEVVDSAAPQGAEEIHAEREVVESMDIEESTAEAVQDMEVVEADVKQQVPEAHSDINTEAVNAGPVLSDESMIGEGFVVEAGSTEESHAEAPMEVQSNREQTLTTLPVQEAEGESEVSVPNADDNQGVEAETAADNQDDSFVFVAPSVDVPEDASATRAEQGVDMGRSEDMAVEAESPIPSGDSRIVPATTGQPPACLESMQSPPTGELSDRALLLQVLEENRKLRDVVGKVLQWGKHQNDTIHNLTSRIEQLEQLEHHQQPPLKLLRGEEGDGRKKVVGPNGRRVDKPGRRSGKVGHKRLLLGDVDSEDWLSAESDDYF